MLEIFGYDNKNHHYLPDLTVETLPEALINENNVIWVDFETATPAEIDILITIFHLDEKAIEDCVHDRQIAKLETFRNYLFFIVQGTERDDLKKNYTLSELDVFLGDRYLITYHNGPHPAIQKAKRGITNGTCRLHQGATFLAYEILDTLIDQYLPILDDFEDKMNLMESQVTIKPFKNKDADEYLDISRQLLDLRRLSVKNREVFYQLSHTNMQFIDESEARLFKDIYDHVVRVVDSSEYFHQTLRSILEIHLSLNSNRFNQVGQVLTTIAVFSLPYTVVTGIYGMNFEWMPLLHHPHGFYYVLTVMTIIPITLMLIFKGKRWI